MTENEVVDYVMKWLKEKNCKIISFCKGNAHGDDIAATTQDGTQLYVECKGSKSRRGNNLDEWLNSAMALFGAIKETVEIRPACRHAIAVPDTENYRKTIGKLNEFFIEQKISIFWVQPDGRVVHAGASISSL